MDLQLTNKIALVAGASRGLGYATALALAREGCRVVVNSRDADKVKAAAEKIGRETGATVLGLAGDVSLPDVPAQLVAQTVEALGGLDLLVTNASGPTPGSVEGLDDAAWQKGIELSLLSHVRFIKAALPHLKKSQAASVLAVTSYSVKQPIMNLLISNSVRAATVGMMKTLATELGRDGIRFNSILPGWTVTERVEELLEFRAKNNGTSAEQESAKIIAEIPLGRMGKPEEFGAVAAFLLSPAASYVHGVALPVDGGIIKGTF
jgi:3-oxoacyl-[acyl-carrier protein] reductase